MRYTLLRVIPALPLRSASGGDAPEINPKVDAGPVACRLPNCSLICMVWESAWCFLPACYPTCYGTKLPAAGRCRLGTNSVASLPHLPLVASVGNPEVHSGIAVVRPVRLQHLRQL